MFYAYWVNFISGRTFAHADKWNLADASSRQIRRAMEKENKVRMAGRLRDGPRAAGGGGRVARQSARGGSDGRCRG